MEYNRGTDAYIEWGKMRDERDDALKKLRSAESKTDDLLRRQQEKFDEMWADLEGIKDDADKVKAYGIKIGTELCQHLLDTGAPGLHFYTCNLEKATLGIMSNLGVKQTVPDAATLSKSVDKTTRYSEIKGTILSDSYDQVGLALRKEKEAAALKQGGGAAEAEA